jgi:bifunctional N-acetylglucosamine-1-phosphate-uridyltransferase/glucosamine-1-phosphate-acetyltransferase GlmU-like protein
MADAAAKADELEIQKQKIESTEKIAGMNATLKDLQAKQALQARQEESGAKLGLDLAHKRALLQQPKKTEK